jgi:hypothetical protein
MGLVKLKEIKHTLMIYVYLTGLLVHRVTNVLAQTKEKRSKQGGVSKASCFLRPNHKAVLINILVYCEILKLQNLQVLVRP